MMKCVTSNYIGEIQSTTDLRPPNKLVLLLFSLAWLAIHLLNDTLHVALSDLPFLFECVPRVISLETVNEGLFLVFNGNHQLLRGVFKLAVSDGLGPDVLHDLILVVIQSLSIIYGQDVHEGFRLGWIRESLLTAKFRWLDDLFLFLWLVWRGRTRLLNALFLLKKSRKMLGRITRFIFVVLRLTSATCKREFLAFIEVQLVLNVVFLLQQLRFRIITN